LPSQLGALNRIVGIFQRDKINYMLIGGWALPAYGQIRSTQDLDIAIEITQRSDKLKKLVSELRKEGYQIPTNNPQLNYSMFIAIDPLNMVEIELWLRPDGIEIDEDLLKRRVEIKIDGVPFWTIGPEDFIVNKLSRSDRSHGDEEDVISVLERRKGLLDNRYMKKRAKKAGVYELLEALKSRIEKLS